MNLQKLCKLAELMGSSLGRVAALVLDTKPLLEEAMVQIPKEVCSA